MNRYLAGGLTALLLVAAGLFWWQSRAIAEQEAGPAPVPAETALATVPEGDAGLVGDAPPMPAEATPMDRAQRRFARYDRDRDGIVSRSEMMVSRAKAFKQLDKDGNNLLSFEEWAVATSERFAGADANKDGRVTPAELAAATPSPPAKPRCRC